MNVYQAEWHLAHSKFFNKLSCLSAGFYMLFACVCRIHLVYTIVYLIFISFRSEHFETQTL